MNTISSIQSTLVVDAFQIGYGAFGLQLNPNTALNPLSWSLAGACDTLTLSVSSPFGIVIPLLTNTSTLAIILNLVNGATYTFTITATKAGYPNVVTSFTTVWKTSLVLF